ncbi:MAG: hypothetical protein PHI12_07610 [Dehalococcoidales bacterium]|nr:hypothetical protein [Dehalococcoidales bacterium]
MSEVQTDNKLSLEPLILICQEKGVDRRTFLQYLAARWDEIAEKRKKEGNLADNSKITMHALQP